MVEIGSYLGKSSSFIACGLREHAKLVCVDTWRNENFPDIKGQDCMQDFLNNMKSYHGRFEVARGKSEEVARQWNKPIDSLFVDGDHSYLGCSTDIKCWLPFVKPGGWVAFHDSSVVGVNRAFNEFFPKSMRLGLPRRIGSIFAARKR